MVPSRSARLQRTSAYTKDHGGRIAKKSREIHTLCPLRTPLNGSFFTETLFRAIAKTNLNLVISTNARITPELGESLLGKCHLLIERADLGRDFGGYRDGISILRRQFGGIERLILLNDSLFFLEGKVGDLLTGLNGEADVIGMAEIFEHHYHIGSFAVSFGRRVLENRRVSRYWRRYRPISTRRWSIHKGEVNLTRTVLKAGFKPRILYHGARLYPHLLRADARELLSAVRLLPSDYREQLYIDYDKLRTHQATATLKALDTLGKSIRRLQKLIKTP